MGLCLSDALLCGSVAGESWGSFLGRGNGVWIFVYYFIYLFICQDGYKFCIFFHGSKRGYKLTTDFPFNLYSCKVMQPCAMHVTAVLEHFVACPFFSVIAFVK